MSLLNSFLHSLSSKCADKYSARFFMSLGNILYKMLTDPLFIEKVKRSDFSCGLIQFPVFIPMTNGRHTALAELSEISPASNPFFVIE